MNRRSALNVIFDEEEAGQVNDDELSDECEESSDYEDEIDYSELTADMIVALDLERDLLASTHSAEMQIEATQEITNSIEPPAKRGRGRPRKNIPSTSSANINTRATNLNSKKNFLAVVKKKPLNLN